MKDLNFLLTDFVLIMNFIGCLWISFRFFFTTHIMIRWLIQIMSVNTKNFCITIDQSITYCYDQVLAIRNGHIVFYITKKLNY